MLACLPGAICRHLETGTVLIDFDRCINCASCAMACPFGVIRYHEDCTAPPQKTVAVKCDNCLERRALGLVPACVEACKTGALTFEPAAQALKRRTDQVARSVSAGAELAEGTPGFTLLNTIKNSLIALQEAAH
jgi:carbon-monoxide dehydrogenase iron sulfur subunit